MFSAPYDDALMGAKDMKTILIADEDAIARELVSLAFPDQMEYRIVGTSTGADAILKSKEIKPDVVIADIFLSDKNGYEVSREIKGDPTLEGTPVILLISSLGVFDEVRAAESCADDFIVKPFSSEETAKKVESLIAQYEREKVESAFNSFFGGVFKTESDLEFDEFNETIAHSRDSLGYKSLEIILQSIAKNLETGCEIAKESGREFKRRMARLGEVITLYEKPKAAGYLRASPFIRGEYLMVLLGLAIVLPIVILAIFANEGEETAISSSDILVPIDGLKGNTASKISLPHNKWDALEEVKLAEENTQSQEEKEVQEVPVKKEMRVSSRQRIRSTSKLRTRGRGEPIQKYGVNSQSALATLPVDTPISAEKRRKHRTQSRPVVVDERKKELEKQLRIGFLLGD